MTPFEHYWAAVPVRVKKKSAQDLWKRKRLDGKIEIILADIEKRKKEDDRWLRGFIPDPPVYLRQERWEDEIVKPVNPITGAVPPVTDEAALLRCGAQYGISPGKGESWEQFRTRVQRAAR
jgi:hypothetical protein